MRHVVALCTGALFGAGLVVSQMLSRYRILGFLDVAGAWDPTLLYVMAGAAGTTLITFPLILRRKHPLLSREFDIPKRTEIGPSLLIGSMLFGIGWGLSGYCPGPGVALLAINPGRAVLYLIGVAAGSLLLYAIFASRGPVDPSSCG